MGFAQRLQRARLDKGYKQNELSLLIGRSKNTISNYENGISKPNLDDLIKLINLLDVDANFLLYDDLSDSIKSKINTSDIDICEGLNPDGKNKVHSYIDDLKSSGKYDNDRSTVSTDIIEELKQDAEKNTINTK
ncbi:MAG: helix-turn-helix domain-containing protein [Hominilimicola sp.]